MIIGDEPQAGFYMTRVVRGGPFLAVMIWHQAPLGWRAKVGGSNVADIMSVWPMCARHPLTVDEYRRLEIRRMLARLDADHPLSNPRSPVDLRKIPPVKP